MNKFVQEIYRHVLGEIRKGALSPGDRVPTEMSLAEKFATTRMNAQLALVRLKDEGILVREKRRGSFVSEGVSKELVTTLLNGASKTVSIIFSEFPGYDYYHWSSSILSELEKNFNLHDYNVVYSGIPSEREAFKELLRQVRLQGVKGVVLILNHSSLMFLLKNIDLLRETSLETYLLHRGNVPVDHIFCNIVSLDPFGEGFLLGEVLTKADVDKVAYLALEGEKTGLQYWSIERLEGLKNSLSDDSKLLFHSDVDMGLLARKGIELIKSGVELLVAHNDSVASFFMDLAEKEGLSVGIDYKIIGFDDNPKYRKYNLTTLSPPIERLAALLPELMVDPKRVKVPGARLSVKVDSRIIFRNSCRLNNE